MSTLGPQGIAPEADHGEWELIGDMIRTKVRRGDNGQPTRGQIIAQFWTSPTAEHARLMTAAPELLAALKLFVEGFDPAKEYTGGFAAFEDKARIALAAIAKAEAA
jgi:hypothetical protein